MTNMKSQVGKRKYLTPEAWVEIRTRYEHGENIRELARKHGINESTIRQRARRHGWGKWGSESDKAFHEAKEKLLEKTASIYDDTVREVNETHLRIWRKSTEASEIALDDTIYKLKVLRAHNMHAAAASKLEHGEKSLPPIPIDTGKEAYRINAINQALRASMHEGERFILGIQDAPALPKDNRDSLDELGEKLDEAGRLYGAEVREGLRQEIRAEVLRELEVEERLLIGHDNKTDKE